MENQSLTAQEIEFLQVSLACHRKGMKLDADQGDQSTYFIIWRHGPEKGMVGHWFGKTPTETWANGEECGFATSYPKTESRWSPEDSVLTPIPEAELVAALI